MAESTRRKKFLKPKKMRLVAHVKKIMVYGSNIWVINMVQQRKMARMETRMVWWIS